MRALTTFAVVGLAFAAPLAAEEPAGRFHVGAGLGIADYSAVYDGVAYDATPAGALVYGGAKLRDRVALEGAWWSQPAVDSSDILGSGVDRLRISTDVRTLVVRGVFSLDLADLSSRMRRWTLFATAGGFAAQQNRQVQELVTGTTDEDAPDDSGVALGAGALYRLSRVTLRAAFEQRNGRHADQSSLGVTAEFRF